MNDPEAIAARLTKAQRATLTACRGNHSDVIDSAIEPLWYCISKNGPGDFSIQLTSFGKAVRQSLQNEPGT